MSKSTITNEQLDELVENLRGSTKSIEEALLDEFGIEGDCLSKSQHHTLKTEIFKCSECEVWYSKDDEVRKTSTHSLCEGCTPYSDEESE